MNKIRLVVVILAFIFTLSGCVSGAKPRYNIPDGWEYVEMANGEVVLYEPIRERNGQMLYSRYNPDDPEGNHGELKKHDVRWQSLLTKKEIKEKRQLQRKLK